MVIFGPSIFGGKIFFGLKKPTFKWVYRPQNIILHHFFTCSKHPLIPFVHISKYLKKYFGLKICGILRNLKKMQNFFGKDFTWFLIKKTKKPFGGEKGTEHVRSISYSVKVWGTLWHGEILNFEVIMVFLSPFLGVERRKTRDKSALQALGHPQNVP